MSPASLASERIGGTSTESMMNDQRVPPCPDLLSPKFTQPGRKWRPRFGEFAGRLGSEVAATRDLQWIGLTFSGENDYRTFRRDELEAFN